MNRRKTLKDTNLTLKKRGRPKMPEKVSIAEPETEFPALKRNLPFGIMRYRENQILEKIGKIDKY